ncbi:MAG: bacteriohemerythrin [Sulfuritalea sp.]|nr:bacteriohemerythrin [Sulfuritalea sp.]
MKINAMQKERVGLKYASALRTLLKHMQEDRGMTAAYLGGDATFGPRIWAKHGQRDDAIKAIDTLNERYGDSLKITERWSSVAKRLQDLEAQERGPGVIAEQSFRDHTVAIDDLLSLFQHLANLSGLAFDTSLDSDSLQSVIIVQLPRLSEALGQIRATTTLGASRGKITQEDRVDIYMRYGSAQSLVKDAANAYRISFESNPSLKNKLEARADAIRANVDKFLELEGVLLNKNQPTDSAEDYFKAATRSIDEIYRALDVTAVALDDLLAARVDELGRKQQLAWAAAGLGLIAIFWLFLAFSFSIARSIGELSDSVRRILLGDFSARLKVSSRDELGELTHHFNEMSIRLEGHIESLTRKSAKLKAQNALIESSDYAIRQISMSTADLLSARNVKDFAEKSLRVLGRILHTPTDCLFCIRDNGTRQSLVIAGTGRFASMTIGPIADFDDVSVRQRIDSGLDVANAAAESRWAVWEIPVSGEQSLLIYLECIQLDGMTIDWNVKALFGNLVTTTFGYLTSLGTVKLAHQAAVVALADLAECKDTDTGEHVMRVAHMTDEIIWVLREENCFSGELTDEFVEQVGTASILHDVGKVAIPDRILLKPGKLDAQERKVMEAHTVQGCAILARAGRVAQGTLYLSVAAQVAESHHEQYDGSGYPKGLKGDAIPLAARIVAVVDVFDALSSKRPYKEPWPIDQVTDYIREKAGSQFDPVVVEAFLMAMDRRSKVSRIVWTSEMSVGHPSLDNDHIKLVDLINQIATAQSTGNQNYVAYALEELSSYAKDHFRSEEDHMVAIDYPDFETHRLAHKSFTDRVNLVRWQYQQGLRDHLNETLLKFLTNWLRTHILELDQRYHRISSEASGT